MDDGLGLVYYNYRHYSSHSGRWIRRDPLGEAFVLKNEMIFCNNQIGGNVDVLGLLWGDVQEIPLPQPPTTQRECKDLAVLIGGASDDNTGVVGNELKREVEKDYPNTIIAYYHWDSTHEAIQAVNRYLDKCPCSKVTLIGHSWGGSELISGLKYLKSSPTLTTIMTLDPVGRSTWVSPKLRNGAYGQWINVRSEPEQYGLSDFIADVGGQFNNFDNGKKKGDPARTRSSTSSASHGDTVNLYKTAKLLLKSLETGGNR